MGTTNNKVFTKNETMRFALAYEANAAAYASALTEAADGLIRSEAEFTLAIFPFSHSISGVYLPRFKAETCNERIEMILEIARQNRKKLLFRLGPTPQPADLAERLTALGVHKSFTQKYMAVGLEDGSAMLSGRLKPAGLEGLSIYRWMTMGYYSKNATRGWERSTRRRNAACCRLTRNWPNRDRAGIGPSWQKWKGS